MREIWKLRRVHDVVRGAMIEDLVMLGTAALVMVAMAAASLWWVLT